MGLRSTSKRLRSGDHFEMFGLERRFDLDEAALERAYLELSRELHPDRNANKTRALALTASMNAAYATLKDPAKRAEHLLRLTGGKTAEQDKRTPPGFLQEMLEKREAVEEGAGSPEMLAELEDREKKAWERIARHFQKGDVAEIRVELNALKYVANLIEELRKKLRS